MPGDMASTQLACVCVRVCIGLCMWVCYLKMIKVWTWLCMGEGIMLTVYRIAEVSNEIWLGFLWYIFSSLLLYVLHSVTFYLGSFSVSVLLAACALDCWLSAVSVRFGLLASCMLIFIRQSGCMHRKLESGNVRLRSDIFKKTDRDISAHVTACSRLCCFGAICG